MIQVKQGLGYGASSLSLGVLGFRGLHSGVHTRLNQRDIGRKSKNMNRSSREG